MNNVEKPREVPSITQFITEEEWNKYGSELQAGRMEPSRFQVFGADVYGRAIEDGHTVGLIFGDVDHLKLVNDQLGHYAGDKIIEIAAGSMRSNADTVVRLGGDEFVAMVLIKHKVDMDIIADRIRASVNESVSSDNGRMIFNDVKTGISLGVAAANREDAMTFDALLALADNKMYENKQKRLEAYAPDYIARMDALVSELEKAGINPADFINYLAYIALVAKAKNS